MTSNPRQLSGCSTFPCLGPAAIGSFPRWKKNHYGDCSARPGPKDGAERHKPSQNELGSGHELVSSAGVDAKPDSPDGSLWRRRSGGKQGRTFAKVLRHRYSQMGDLEPLCVFVCTYTCMHTYIHTYIRTNVHTYITCIYSVYRYINIYIS